MLQLYLLPKSEVVTEEATRRAVNHLALVDLEGLEKVVLSRIFGSLEYQGLSDEICKTGEEKGVVRRHDRYFHH